MLPIFTVTNLLNVYSRLWLDTKEMVDLIRKSGFIHIFPANLLGLGDPMDAQRIAIEFMGPHGITHAIYEKKGVGDAWVLTTSPEEVKLSSTEVLYMAELLSHGLPSGYQPPTVTARHLWEVYHQNYLPLTALTKAVSDDLELESYPLSASSPDTKRPEAFILLSQSGESLVIIPQQNSEPHQYWNVTNGGALNLAQMHEFAQS